MTQIMSEPNGGNDDSTNSQDNTSNHIPFGGILTPPPPSSKGNDSNKPVPLEVIKSFHPQLLTFQSKTSDSGAEFKDPKALMCKYRTESLLLAEIHTKAAQYCDYRNTFCTLFALSVSLLCSVLDPILQRYAEDLQKVFTTASFALIGGLNVMFNFMAFQQRCEHHKQTRDAHRQIVEVVEVSLAYASTNTIGDDYDFTKILGEIRQIHTNLTKISPPIPSSIAQKYEKILCPSLLKRELKEIQKAEN